METRDHPWPWVLAGCSLGPPSLGERRVDTHVLSGPHASAWAMLSSFFRRELTAGSGCAFLLQPPACFKGFCQPQTPLNAEEAWALLQAARPGLGPWAPSQRFLHSEPCSPAAPHQGLFHWEMPHEARMAFLYGPLSWPHPEPLPKKVYAPSPCVLHTVFELCNKLTTMWGDHHCPYTSLLLRPRSECWEKRVWSVMSL